MNRAAGMLRAIALAGAVLALGACGTLGTPTGPASGPAPIDAARAPAAQAASPTYPILDPSAPAATAAPATVATTATAPANGTAPAAADSAPAAAKGPTAPRELAEATVPAAPIALSPDELARPAKAFPEKPVGNLWDRIRRGFGMPELDSKLVEAHERALLARPDYLERMVERSRPYLYHIVNEVEKRHLPTELALLPFIESAMDPGATSRAKAAGLWQFIPSTGRAFDLKQNWWVDNRRDVVQSTRAALDYLEKIYALNDNDWFLALASYNWGEGAVARARRVARRHGRPDDYEHIRMPRETRHYVPKLIALKNIIERADALGLPLPYVPDQPYFVTIDQLRPIDLKLAARFAGMTVDEFVALNPAHNRPVITASRTHSIKLPADRLHGFLAAIEHHEAQNQVFATWQPYTLQKGENLAHVARKFSVSVDELRKANGLRGRGRLLAGSCILAPHKHVTDESRVEDFKGAKLVEEVASPARYYRSRRTESLHRIARRFRVSLHNLRAWNGLGGKVSTVRAGTRLMVRPASESTVVTDERGKRRVVKSRRIASRTTHHGTIGKTRTVSEASAPPVHAIRIRTTARLQAKRPTPRM